MCWKQQVPKMLWWKKTSRKIRQTKPLRSIMPAEFASPHNSAKIWSRLWCDCMIVIICGSVGIRSFSIGCTDSLISRSTHCKDSDCSIRPIFAKNSNTQAPDLKGWTWSFPERSGFCILRKSCIKQAQSKMFCSSPESSCHKSGRHVLALQRTRMVCTATKPLS